MQRHALEAGTDDPITRVDRDSNSSSSSAPLLSSPEEGGAGLILNATYSFLFGDGEPRQPTEALRWKLTGLFIQSVLKEGDKGRDGDCGSSSSSHDGSSSVSVSVSGDALLAFLPNPPNPKTLLASPRAARTRDTTAHVSPIVAHFRGRPRTCPRTGSLRYEFPELVDVHSLSLGPEEGSVVDSLYAEALERSQSQGAASESAAAFTRVDRGKMLVEGIVRFDDGHPQRIRVALGLGIGNFVGVSVLWAVLRMGVMPQMAGLFLVPVLYWLVPLLFVYAVAYLIVPALRYLYITLLFNPRVHTRNQWRLEYSAASTSAHHTPHALIQ